MRKLAFISLLGVLIILSGTIPAKTKESIRIVLPHANFHDPPHYLVSEKGSIYGGIQPDILKQAFPDKKVELFYQPFRRATQMIKHGRKLNCIAPTAPELVNKVGYFNSKENFATYHNMAIVLKKSGIKIKSVKDLYNKRVLAFPAASKFLGREFAQMTRFNSKKYMEIEKYVGEAVLTFFRGDFDVLIYDKNSFNYYKNHYRMKDQALMFKLFPPTKYGITCNSKELINKFDQGVRKLKESGQMDKIIEFNTQ